MTTVSDLMNEARAALVAAGVVGFELSLLHDEIACVCPAEHAQAANAVLVTITRRMMQICEGCSNAHDFAEFDPLCVQSFMHPRVSGPRN